MKMIYTLVTFGVTFPKATCAALYFSSGACPRGSENPKNMSSSTSCGVTRSALLFSKNSASTGML